MPSWRAGTFKLIQLEKERNEKIVNASAIAAVENDDSMMMELVDGAPPFLPLLPQQQTTIEMPQQQIEKTTEIPFLEQALETELHRMVADKQPNKSNINGISATIRL